jgi:hypothetical protein
LVVGRCTGERAVEKPLSALAVARLDILRQRREGFVAASM